MSLTPSTGNLSLRSDVTRRVRRIVRHRAPVARLHVLAARAVSTVHTRVLRPRVVTGVAPPRLCLV